MRVNKRSRVDIYSAILSSLLDETNKNGKASPTRVAHRSNIPYDRFLKIISKFIELGLIQRTDDGILLTESGLKCLKEIRKTNEILRRMGLLL